jgi:hypothetical protein
MFAEEEKPLLQTLPIEPFRYYQYGERVVHLYNCVKVERAYYGLPPGWIGHEVQVQWDALHVRILDPRNYQLLREHLRQFPGNYRINDEDRSNKTPLSTVQLLARRSPPCSTACFITAMSLNGPAQLENQNGLARPGGKRLKLPCLERLSVGRF